MNVLVITGDKKFGPGNERYELQRSAVDALDVVYWGRGSVWPIIPGGKFDVVTAQDPFWRGLFAWRVARRLKAKFNVQVHTDLSVYGGSKHVLMQIVLRHADTVRVVSQKIKEQVEKIGIKASITVLPVYIDTLRFSSIVSMPHSAKNILWIGRLEDEKDPLEAIRVFKEVVKEIPTATLLILGDGSLREEVESQARDLPGVRVLGWQNPTQYLDTADVVLCTSKHESFGASIVEALAAGVPVVAPGVGIASEAGALVLPRAELPKGVIEVLRSGIRGTLRLTMLARDVWVRAWKESL